MLYVFVCISMVGFIMRNRSGDEAALFVRKLQAILQEIKTCSGQMAQGSLRVDANVSVRRKGDTQYGTRVEIKNVNGTRHLRKAISM